MDIHVLENTNSVINNYLYEIRSKDIQTDSMRFRTNIERIGQLIAYEISKTFVYKNVQVQTPLGSKKMDIIDENIVIASILRAGLPLHNGILSVFDKAENCFVSAYRKYHSKDKFEIFSEYIASPDLTDKTVILCDPMLATGSSMDVTYRAILAKGLPKRVIICTIVASEQAMDFVKKNLTNPMITDLYVATIDPKLDDHAYIVPGIGDAGDLCYGSKL